MPAESSPPDFDVFAAWLAARLRTSASAESTSRYADLLAAARTARNEVLADPLVAAERLEVLRVLAAADKTGAPRPPELTTARGFRVTLSYDEGRSPQLSSICVLVRCPPELIDAVRGEVAFLWNGVERFELGQFDADGKAIGTLPAGLEISMSDFEQGKVKLEEPLPPARD